MVRFLRIPLRATLCLVFALAMPACQHPAVIGGQTSGAGGGGAVTGGGGKGGAAAATGSGGARADGGGADTGPSRGPTPPQNGTNFPFPQNRMSASCSYPRGYRNEDVQAAWNQWKADTITGDGAGGFLRVKRPNDAGLAVDSTVSEGIGYGMLMAVFMGEQSVFDQLWKYEQMHLDMYGLMNWYILKDGTLGMNGMFAASDADEDMAFALVMADKQWGGKGSLDKNYIDYAKDQIKNIWDHDVLHSGSSHGMGGGDNMWDWSCLNISYFAPAYYRVFKTVDTGNDWDAVVKTAYDTIGNALDPSRNGGQANSSNGLVPAWCHSEGPPNGACPTGATNYQYDSCRTPFRIALDWCWFGETRAQAYLAKTSAFFSGIGVANIADGYALSGTPQPANPGKSSAAFVGPAGAGAMSDATYQSFVDGAYSAVATRTLLAGGQYYEESWTVMSLLMMTGNFLNYTAY